LHFRDLPSQVDRFLLCFLYLSLSQVINGTADANQKRASVIKVLAEEIRTSMKFKMEMWEKNPRRKKALAVMATRAKEGMLTMKKPRIIFLSIILSTWATVSAVAQAQEKSPFVRLDAALNDIVPPDVKVEKLADGFRFTEGPVWVRKGGYLLFSDIPGNVIHKWNPADGKVSVLLEKSGFTGSDATGVGREVITEGPEVFYNIGSNGITLDRQGRVVYNAMGDRQIVRLEADGRRTVLASHYEGKRLNSTNDLVYKSDGSLYFTDPPSALRGGDNDPKKELPFTGVFMLKDGKLQLLIQDIRPNGLTFSPDEKYLYVADTNKRSVVRYEVRPDGTVANGQVFIDMSSEKTPGGPDGMKVDEKGNLYSTGPGGVWIISPAGKHLGTLVFPERPANFAFGDADGKTLYVTARRGLYRIRLKIPGIRP